MAIFQETIDAAMNTNLKNVTDMSTIAAGISNQNAVSHQQLMNGLTALFFGEATGQRAGNDPAEAISSVRVLSADIAKVMAELSAAASAMQGLVKAAQTTPPPTGG